jgi:hypothetical protein
MKNRRSRQIPLVLAGRIWLTIDPDLTCPWFAGLTGLTGAKSYVEKQRHQERKEEAAADDLEREERGQARQEERVTTAGTTSIYTT